MPTPLSTRTRRQLDTAGAATVAAVAEKFAEQQGYRVVIAVVDAWGNPLLLTRTEGAQAASSQVAVDKARTAAIFVRPSRDIEAQVSGGRLGALALHGAAALTGGVPLVVDGEVVGAIGTSGETPDEDESVSIAAAEVAFSTVSVPALAAHEARVVADAVAAECTHRGVNPVVAVVDAGGELVQLWRPDAAQVASVGVATDKARTAAIYRRPSKDFEDQASGGRPSALHLAHSVPLQGGIPLVRDGFVIGAVGVSGAHSADEDQELAVLGATTHAAGSSATHIPARDVAEKFATGGGLLLTTPAYKLDAGRRSGPGAPELHEAETDIIRIESGTATVEAGGDVHELVEGDVLIVPPGVPHTFTAASDPLEYFVVKVEG
ncbi:MAG TPA: heme-binding protein [Jatrophihabitans sp.]|nr:heme-binding protein [Jatrophihabitans sp.]